MTGSHEVEGSIPFGSTRGKRERAVSESATKVALFALLVATVVALAAATAWAGGLLRGGAEGVAVELEALESGSITVGAPAGPTGWYVAAAIAGERATLASRLYAGRRPRPSLPDGVALVAFALGEKPTGGFGVALESATLDGGTLTVRVAVSEPAPDAMLMQMIDCPYALAKVMLPDGATVERVEFVDAATGKTLASV